MVKLYPGRKVTLCTKDASITLYGKEAMLLSVLTVLTLVFMAVAAVVKAAK